MSSITPARPLGRRLRSRFAVVVSTLALALSGMLATAGVAHADDHIEIDGPAATVPVNTPYTYTVTVFYEQTPSNGTTLYVVPISLSGAAATVTAVTDDAAGLDCSVSDPPTSAYCYYTPSGDTFPLHITATVLPTAEGAVTANTVWYNATVGFPFGTDSATTTIGAAGPACTITGTAGNDTLNGTNGDDVICGLGGNDTIDGGNGSDSLYGGDGNDAMGGGNGDDYLYGQAGDDTNKGETLLGSLLYLFDNGNDTIDGGPGNDDLDGQKGNDTLVDTSGTDTMSGNVGTDTINVQDGVGGDTANGGLGNDTCTIDPGDTATSC